MFSRRGKDQEKRQTPKYTCVCYCFLYIHCLWRRIFLYVQLLFLARNANLLAELISLLALYPGTVYCSSLNDDRVVLV